MADKHGEDLKSRFVVGRRVRHDEYGEGTINKVKRAGVLDSIMIDFDSGGEKGLYFNSEKMELLED